MRTYLTIELYPDPTESGARSEELDELEEREETEEYEEPEEREELEESEEREETDLEALTENIPKPYRTIEVLLGKGSMVIKSVADDPEYTYEIEYPEQMMNEFLIQTELLDIRRWDPMHYSPAYDGGEKCSWELDYHGLKGEEEVRSGRGTYPKGWPLLIDLINAYRENSDGQQESVHVAAGYAVSLLKGDGDPAEAGESRECADGDPAEAEESRECADSAEVRMVDMVYLLSVMRMPQDVIAAGIVRAASLEHGYDAAGVRDRFDGPVAELLDEYGDDWNLPEAERRIELIDKVRKTGSVYFKRLVLAEVMSLLIRVKAGIDEGEGFDDGVMSLDEMGLYYAEMISALGSLEHDDRAGVLYSVLVDMYKSVFISYSLDSLRGVIYQMQGTAAGVVLHRGEYDWRPLQGEVPDGTCQISKSLALFLADRWRKQADEALVRDGNKTGLRDVPDLKALKVVMSCTRDNKARKDNKVALSVLSRMVNEGEQVLAALRAGDKALRLIERGDIDDVANIPVSFLGLEDDEGNKMAAVFTSMDEVGDIAEAEIEAVPLKTLLLFVKHMDRLDGIIIDPFSDRFLVTKETIAEMLDGLKKDTSAM